MGTIALAGGGEFGGKIELLDRRTIEAAGGPCAQVVIIPAAAAPDKNHIRAGTDGVGWFRGLGLAGVEALPLLDRISADHPAVVRALRRANLIYILGGFPGHLATALAGSLAWAAILAALDDGAVVSGSSAGAMVLCEHFYDPHQGSLRCGLNLIPGVCILPHHDTFGKTWVPRLKKLIPDATLIGIDERTGLIGDQIGGSRQVWGRGAVVIYRKGRVKKFGNGETFLLE